MNFQIVPKVNGEPYELIAMPAHTMRIKAKESEASKYVWDPNKREQKERAVITPDGPDDAKYVQIHQGNVIAEFTPRELSWGVRNPRADMRAGEYGLSEIEIMVSVLTSLMNAEQYNSRFFSQGTAVKGILNFKGAIPERQLKEFRREWHALLTGVNNAFRTPVTNSEDLQWISMHSTNRDMEYSSWMDYLIKVVTSIYQIDPVEINFQYGNTGQTNTLNQGPQEWKIRESRARGLRPLLHLYEEMLTKHVVMSFDEDFELVFAGLDSDAGGMRERVASLAKEHVSAVMTVDEVREDQYDLPPLPDGKGDVVLNPQWLQWAQTKDAQAQQGEEEQSGGGEFEGFSEEEFFAEEAADLTEDAQTPPPEQGTEKSQNKPPRKFTFEI
jgi:hypothetical protein